LFGKKKEKKPDSTSRIGSITLFLSIPAYFIVGCLGLLSIFILSEFYPFDLNSWAAFISAGLACFLLLRLSRWPKLQIFIHELKHAIMIWFVGAKVKQFKVGENDGNVVYEIERDDMHKAHLITLAPYTLPIFSPLMLLACLISEGPHKPLLAAGLGFFLALDFVSGMAEFHPAQTDLTRIYGKLLISGLFIGGSWFCWIVLCSLWVHGGRNAYVDSSLLILRLTLDAIKDYRQ
jgi:hypothetical protein